MYFSYSIWFNCLRNLKLHKFCVADNEKKSTLQLFVTCETYQWRKEKKIGEICLGASARRSGKPNATKQPLFSDVAGVAFCFCFFEREVERKMESVNM